MTTYVINPITNELESAQPRQTVGDKYGLQKFNRLKAAVPLLAPALLPAAAAFLGLSGTGLVLQQKVQNYFENNPEALSKFKEYIKDASTMALPFGTLPGDRPEEEAEEKEFGKLKGFDKAPERLKEKGTTIPEKIKTDQPLKTPPKTEPLPGLSKPEDVDTSILYRTEEEKAKAREYARKKREREKAGDTEKFRPDPEKEAVINTAIKEYRDVAPPIKSGDNRAYKPGNTGFETIKIATEEFRKQYGRNPSNTEIQKYTGNNRGTVRKAFQNHGDILGELMSMDDYRLISPKTVDTKLTEEYQEEARNKLINEAIELDTVRTYKDEVFFKNDERRNFFVDNFIKRANFGLNRKGVPGLTYEQLAKEFNMSKGQVSKIIQVLQKDPLISSQLDRPEGRDASYYGTVNKQVLAEGRKQLAPWERSNVDIQDNKVSEVNKMLSGLTLDEVKEQYPQIITDFKWKLVKTGDDKGKIIEVDRPDEKLEKDIKKAFSIEHGKNKSTREVDIQRLTNRHLTTKKNNDLLVSIKAYIKREGESSPEINDWLTERGIRIIVDKKSYGAPPEVMFNSKTGEHVSFNKELEFYGLDGDVVGPTKERYKILKLKDDVDKKFGKDTITTADEAPEPDSSILRRMFEAFNKRNMSAGGRVGFQDGTPPVIPGNELDYSELQVMMDNPNEYNTFPKGTFTEELDKAVYGTDDEKTLMQRFNQMFLDPRAYPYYVNKAISGAANIPEFAFRTVPALAALGSETVVDLVADKYPEGKLQRFGERISPKITEAAKEKVGLTGLIEEGEKNLQFPSTQEYVGDSLQILAEFPGPVTPFVFFRAAPKILRQIQNLGLSATAIEKLNKKVEQQLSSPNQSRRDFLITTGAGGAVAMLKYLGLDKLLGTGTKVAEKAVIKSGGTPQYFFDFVNLIQRKGKDVSDTQSVIERQKVIEYKDYTLTDTDGYITIRKTDEDMGRDEMMEYKPAEGVVDEATGTSKEVPAQYDETTARPDPNDLGNFDTDSGFESIDEVLEELAKDGKTYSKDDLLKMGIDPDALGNYPTGAGSIPEGRVGEANPFKPKKAEGGIIAGVKSGPAPKSGPTPHGLPYVAKNVRPIKERK